MSKKMNKPSPPIHPICPFCGEADTIVSDQLVWTSWTVHITPKGEVDYGSEPEFGDTEESTLRCTACSREIMWAADILASSGVSVRNRR